MDYVKSDRVKEILQNAKQKVHKAIMPESNKLYLLFLSNH